MEDECGVSDKSSGVPRSESMILAGEKRASVEVEGRQEFAPKRVKMRDLDSVLRVKERTASEKDLLSVNHIPRAIDLNAHIDLPSSSVPEDDMAFFEETSLHSSEKQEVESDFSTLLSPSFGLDLNARDTSSSKNHDPFHPFKNYEHLKLKDDFECASSVGPFEEKDSMKMWKEMKQNGFLSSSHGGVPMPKPRGRKNKNDGIKRKMELAKKEQVDRFAKIAAPTGLLNGLNPGIINHVRNSKQVHSIIEALVRSEKIENSLAGIKERDQTKRGTKDFCEVKDLNRCRASYEDGTTSTFPGSRQTSTTVLNSSASLISEVTRVDNEICKVDPIAFGSGTCFSHPNLEGENDVLALKLSSSAAKASENASSLSNGDSGNLNSVTSLSVKAASVASQWLELLLQDIKGRLAALRRSKKRVRAVIHTELPFLLLKEFPSVQEHESCIKKSSTRHPDSATADAHRAKWNTLFDQMDKTLSEEERQLECWLNQVREMHLHCEKGLLKYNEMYSLQHPGTSENDCRLYSADNPDRDLAVRAAAASIYSTCNYLSSMENLPCC